tara:strand:+ start:567 stop:1718 length:1152 start_codon:yes stop_codon:yes gene_type:complete
MLFSEIVGNTIIKKQLLNSVKNNRISHAQLFLGEGGCAKLALALAFAQFLNCENSSETDSCNKCSSCLKYNKLLHPDLHIVIPVLKEKNIKNPVSDNFIVRWRSFILNNYYSSPDDWIESIGSENKLGNRGKIYTFEADNIHKKLKFKNYEAKYRLVLIWMPERMNVEASNKLLKLLEEPPRGTVFILVSENFSKLLPTITSRLQTVKVENFTSEDIVEHFGENIISIEKAKEIKRLTGGDFNKIAQLINHNNPQKNLLNDFSSWMRISYKFDVNEIAKWVNLLALKGRKQQELFLLYAIKMIRECLIYNFAGKNLLKANRKELDFLSNFSPFLNDENIIVIVEKLEESVRAIRRNANAKILFFDLSLQMVQLLKVKRKFAVK